VTRLEQAIARLERAVAQLDAALPVAGGREPRAADEAGRMQLVGAIAARVDAALARIGQVIGDED